MKIAIVSKIEHAQPHAEALRKLGHDVDIIDPKGVYPPSYDVYVCRNSSVSHQASWDMADLRLEGKTVIFENSKTKILQAIQALQPAEEGEMFENLTINNKLAKALDVFSVFNPSQNTYLTDHQIEELARIGMASSVSEAKKVRDALASVPKGSWAGIWGQAKANPDLIMTVMYKLGHTGNRMQVQLLSKDRQEKVKLEKAARVMGLMTEEQARAYKPQGRSAQPLLQELHEAAQAEVNVPKVEELPPEIDDPVEVSPTPTVVVVAEVTDGVPAPKTPRPDRVEPAPKPASSPKTDIKELLSMLNDTLLALNIADIRIVPSKDGAKIEVSQIVVRKVTSLDDLE